MNYVCPHIREWNIPILCISKVSIIRHQRRSIPGKENCGHKVPLHGGDLPVSLGNGVSGRVGESVDAFGAEFDGENDQMRIYLRIDIKIKIIRRSSRSNV